MVACGEDSTNSDEEENFDEETKVEDDEENEAEHKTGVSEQNEAGQSPEEVEEKPQEPQYEVLEDASIVPIKEDANEEVVLLTIDDAPDTYALEMAETLQNLNVNAIFFVNGHFIDTSEEQSVLKTIHDMGFMIGNHTYNHPYLPDLTEEEQKEEIVALNDLVEDIIGERPRFFRAPNGANTDFSRQVAEEEDMIVMNWSYGYDWESDYQSKEAIADIMVNTELLTSGANLLMHDREWTAAALEDIVTGLQAKGYEIVDPALIKTK